MDINTMNQMNQPKGGSKNYVIGLVIIVLIIIGVSFAGGKRSVPNGESSDTVKNTDATEITAESAAAVGQKTTEAASKDTVTTKAKTVEVVYTDENGFTSDNITINKGDTVKFVNKSSGAMWVGSNEHPTHSIYSGTALQQHCPDNSGTAFDQCKTGNEYSFTFNKTGSWSYHDHLRPRMGGVIIVK